MEVFNASLRASGLTSVTLAVWAHSEVEAIAKALALLERLTRRISQAAQAALIAAARESLSVGT